MLRRFFQIGETIAKRVDKKLSVEAINQQFYKGKGWLEMKSLDVEFLR
jgi:hypothetical protein